MTQHLGKVAFTMEELFLVYRLGAATGRSAVDSNIVAARALTADDRAILRAMIPRLDFDTAELVRAAVAMLPPLEGAR